MRYSREFIALQTTFAAYLATITGEALPAVLFEHTLLRHLIGIHDIAEWRRFVEAPRVTDLPGHLYSAYLDRAASEPDEDGTEPRFGCFRYVYPFHDQPMVRLHFINRQQGPAGPLSDSDVATRKAELAEMFRYIRQRHPEAGRVRGGSWLYNLPSYQRLFPPEYVRSAVSVGYETGFFSLWGQFLRRDGKVRETQASRFLVCLYAQTRIEDCLACFPYHVLRPECRIEVFYTFYSGVA